MPANESNPSMNNADTRAVTNLVTDYLNTINRSDLDGMVRFYASDAALMPEYSDAAVGLAEIRKAYQALFESFSLHATISVDEVVQMAPDWVFARCHSSGTMTVAQTGQPGPLIANQELFIFQKINGSWKIARYSFSSRRPPSVTGR